MREMLERLTEKTNILKQLVSLKKNSRIVVIEV